MKITKDNFVWALLTPEEAKELQFTHEIFKLFSDDNEAIIESDQDLSDAIDLNIQLGLEVGSMKELEQEYDEGAQNRYRNNDKTSFAEWLENKSELTKEI